MTAHNHASSAEKFACLICTPDRHSHPSLAHAAACPICHPDKTVPELNEAYRRVKESEQAHVDLDDAIYGRNG